MTTASLYSQENPAPLTTVSWVATSFSRSGESDWYAITLTAGVTYQFDLLGAAFGLGLTLKGSADVPAAYLYLRDTKQAPIAGAYAWSGSQGFLPTLPFTATTTGIHYVQAQGVATGTYLLKASVKSADDFGSTVAAHGSLAVGSSRDANLVAPNDKDWFALELNAGTLYRFDLIDKSGKAVSEMELDLFNASAVKVDWAGKAEAGPRVALTGAPETSGRYFLQATSSTAAGDYSVQATAIADDFAANVAGSGRLAVGGVVSGKLEAEYDRDWFEVELEAGQAYQFKVTSAGPAVEALDVVVRDPVSGATTKTSWPFVPGVSGKYYLEVDAYDPGAYQLSATQLASSNDEFLGRANGTRIDGGAGRDTVAYLGALGQYQLARDGATFKVALASGSAPDVLVNIERLMFNGASVALDMDGVGGAAYRLYRAAFDRTPDKGGVGYWMAAMDKGLPLATVAQGFVGSAEFTALYGSAPSHTEFVSRLYQNVLDRPGEAAGINFWVDVLGRGMSRAEVLVGFSDSNENVAAVAALIGNGFEYTPFA